MPHSVRILAALSLAALVAVATGRPAAAQIAPETHLDSRGYAATMLHNRGAEVLDVTVELRHGSVTNDKVELGEAVDALISPAAFKLAPDETQTIRILVREELPPGGVVRLVTTLTPRAVEPPPTAAPVTEAQARLTFATRLITKVVAE